MSYLITPVTQDKILEISFGMYQLNVQFIKKGGAVYLYLRQFLLFNLNIFNINYWSYTIIVVVFRKYNYSYTPTNEV
jgi:hypothetical protein